jgi:hypothetical protein
MSVGDIIWFFFMFTALQPVLRQRMLEAMRTRKIARSCTGRRPCGSWDSRSRATSTSMTPRKSCVPTR